MEEIVSILQKKIKEFGIDIINQEPLTNQEQYIGACLSGFAEYLKNSKATSIQGLFEMIEIFNEDLLQELIKQNIIPKSRVALSLAALSNVIIFLLKKFILKRDTEDVPKIQIQLVRVVQNLLVFCDVAKEKIANHFINTIYNGMTILVYGYSSHIIYSLKKARKEGKTFTVYVSQASEKDSSQEMMKQFKESDIDCKLILGVSIGFYLSKVDVILSGADAVCENGGIIHKIGTYTTAICANNFKKPFYVLVDSLKYLKLYALDQTDLQQTFIKYFNTDEINDDFTPPEFITLFFTDKGIFTPSAICDEIIQLFYN